MMYTGGNYSSGGVFSPFDFLGNAGVGKSQMQMASANPIFNGPIAPLSSMAPNYGEFNMAESGKGVGSLLGLLGGMSSQSVPRMIQANPNRPGPMTIQDLLRKYRGAYGQ